MESAYASGQGSWVGPTIVVAVVAWLVLCVAAASIVHSLARRRALDEIYGFGYVLAMCLFLTPLFAAIVVGTTPEQEYLDENGNLIEDGKQSE